MSESKAHRMAYAATLIPSEEKANYFRLSSLLIEGGKVALKSKFDQLVPPNTLYGYLRTANIDGMLQKLKCTKVLNQSQEDLLISSGKSVCSSTFDVTLLTLLLRNVCKLSPPVTGWNSEPSQGDQSEEADIVRLRLRRNKIQHAAQTEINQTDFERDWQELREVLLRLGGNVPDLETCIDKLKNNCIDPSKEQHYKEIMRQWELNDKQFADDIKNLTAVTNTHTEEIKSVKRDQAVTQGTLSSMQKKQMDLEKTVELLKEEMKKPKVSPAFEALVSRSSIDLEHFKSSAETFVKTKAFLDAQKILEEKRLLVLCGHPGEGKTTIAKHLLLTNWDNERCLVLEEPEDWKTINWKMQPCDAILIDDIFGAKTMNRGLLREWLCKLGTIVKTAEQKKASFILTTQPYILEKCKPELAEHGIFTTESNMCIVTTNELSKREKEQMLEKHLQYKKKEFNKSLIAECVKEHGTGTVSSAFGFPECVFLFSTEYSIFNKGSSFFKSPASFFRKLFEKFREDKEKFLAFLVVWARGNEPVTCSTFLDQPELIAGISKQFGYEQVPGLASKIKSSLDTHSGGLITYMQNDGSYTFSHNTIRDMVGLVASRFEPRGIIRSSTKEFFMEYITVREEKQKQQNLFYVEPYLLPELAARIVVLLNRKRPSYSLSRQKGQVIEVETMLDMSLLLHDVFQNSSFVEKFYLYLSEQTEAVICSILGTDVMKISEKLQPYGLVTDDLKLNLIGASLFANFNSDAFVKGYFRSERISHLGHDKFMEHYIQPCLLFAVDKGNVEIVREVLNAGAKTSGNALYMAAFNNNIDILEILLQQQDTDPNEKGLGVNGNNALLIASKRGHTDVVKCLLRYKADPNITNNSQRRALDKAIMSKHEDITEALIVAGAFLEYRSGKLQRTPLHVASDKGLLHTVTCLINSRADINSVDRRGHFAIHCAAMQGKADVVKAFLELDIKQGELRASTFGKMSQVRGMTAFHYAARKGHSDVVDVLIEMGIDPDVPNSFGHTPAYIAASFGHLNVLQKLKNKADMNRAEKQGFTPLHVAVFRNHEPIVKFLCDCSSVDINRQDKFGKTPLHVAAEKGCRGVAVLLLAREQMGVDVRMRTKRGNTVYHLAKNAKKFQVMAPLFRAKDEVFADMEILNACGMAASGRKQEVQLQSSSVTETMEYEDSASASRVSSEILVDNELSESGTTEFENSTSCSEDELGCEPSFDSDSNSNSNTNYSVSEYDSESYLGFDEDSD